MSSSVWAPESLVKKSGNSVESFIRMQKKHVGMVSNPTVVGLLKACNSNTYSDSIIQGRLIHGKIIEEGREFDVYIGSILIDIYSKSQCVTDAEFVFRGLGSRKNLISWGALINGYVRNGQEMRVFKLLDEMIQEGIQPNEPILVSSLKACGNLRLLKQSRKLHDLIFKIDLSSNVGVGNKLIDVYAKCGFLSEAYKVFEQISRRDIISWNIIIQGYARHGHYLHSLKMLERMRKEDLRPDKVTFLGIIRACCSFGHAKLLHDCILRSGLISDVEVGNALINMYAHYGRLEDARKVFDNLPNQDLVSWTTLMVGFSHNDNPLGAIDLFWKMLQKGIEPNRITFSCILHACGKARCFIHFHLIHDFLIRSGIQPDIAIGNALIYSYLNCGSLKGARKIFDRMSDKNLVSWTTMIIGYANHERSLHALELIQDMQKVNIVPDEIMFSCILRACDTIYTPCEGWLMHDCIIKVCENLTTSIANALISMYARLYSLKDACKVFDGLHLRDALSWDAIIMAYSQHGLPSKALDCFWQMEQGNIEPVAGTLFSVLKACGSSVALGQGRIVHDYIVRHGYELEVTIESSLLDMYVKFANLKEAYRLFEMIQHKDVVSWGAIIDGFSEHGRAYDALRLFEQMPKDCIEPSKAIYTSILKACGRIGAIGLGRFIHDQVLKGGFEFDSALGNTLIDMYARCGSLGEAQRVFDTWKNRDEISRCIIMAANAKYGERLDGEASCVKALGGCLESSNEDEVYGYIIDVLSRKGLFYVAEDLVETMPNLPDDISWTSVLSGCRMHGKLEMGRKCFDRALKIDPNNASTYVLMSNIHANFDELEDKEFNSDAQQESNIMMVNRQCAKSSSKPLNVGVPFTKIGSRYKQQQSDEVVSCAVLEKPWSFIKDGLLSLWLQLTCLYIVVQSFLKIFSMLFLLYPPCELGKGINHFIKLNNETPYPLFFKGPKF